jgi:hypothetical protein
LCSCTNTSPLFLNSGEERDNFSHIKIKAPSPQIEYSLRRHLSNKLSRYNLGKYKIKIIIEEESDVAAFSEREVVKEQKRLIACLVILDKNYNEICRTKTDSYSTYEVNDNVPLASMESEESTTNLLAQNLAEELERLIIKYVVHSK